MHISKRDGIEPWKAWLIRLAAVILALVVCAGVIFALTGLNPIEVYKGIFDGAVGTKRRIWMTIRDTLVLLCIAIGITPAFKMRFWNHWRRGAGTDRGRYIRCHDDLLGKLPSRHCAVSADAFGQRPVRHGVGSDPGIF